MSRIRRVEIENFRSIQSFDWRPSSGINCLIGPGDSGKSTVLDAIDFCLGARRTIQFSDADFHDLDVSRPIKVTLTIGDLPDELLRIETYGMYVRGLNMENGEIHDEPGAGLETVLTPSCDHLHGFKSIGGVTAISSWLFSVRKVATPRPNSSLI